MHTVVIAARKTAKSNTNTNKGAELFLCAYDPSTDVCVCMTKASSNADMMLRIKTIKQEILNMNTDDDYFSSSVP